MKKMNIIKSVFLGISAFGIVSCTSITAISAPKKTSQVSLENSKWTLIDNVKGKVPTLNVEAGRITGNAGCNNYSGEVILNSEEGQFSASKIGSTKMACNNLSVEQNFLKMLQEANRYNVKNNILELYKDNLLLMKLQKSE